MIFTTAEHVRVKTVIPKGLKLLGFKSRESVSSYNYITPCLFLYPDETQIVGSTKLFLSLWQKCIEKDRVAFAVLVQRSKAVPTYVALVPQDNAFHNDDQVRNNGFRVLFLPYKDDIRNLDVYTKSVSHVDPDDENLFRKLIKKIKFKYNPSFFENPALQKIYCNIESIVYKADEVAFEDSTMRHLDQQSVKTLEICSEIIERFGAVSLETTKKRAAPSSSGSGPASKTPKLTGDLVKDVVNAYNAGNVCLILVQQTNDLLYVISFNFQANKLTVAQLREYLKAQGVPFKSSAKKDDLLSTVGEIQASQNTS